MAGVIINRDGMFVRYVDASSDTVFVWTLNGNVECHVQSVVETPGVRVYVAKRDLPTLYECAMSALGAGVTHRDDR